MAIYGASKAALERIAISLAAEVYADGVAVNTIAPVAAVHTPGAATISTLSVPMRPSPRSATSAVTQSRLHSMSPTLRR
jgi:NAD(P)-dependent dehydrogenase (short-subunit alcohol dehydrogenase family)